MLENHYQVHPEGFAAGVGGVGPDTEYGTKIERLALSLIQLLHPGCSSLAQAPENLRVNYRLDARDIIHANPHLLTLPERERLVRFIPELAY